jgi:hypothetical protein
MRGAQSDCLPFFYPDQIEAMHVAFERACKRMRLIGTKATPIRELVAIKIVELAKSGPFDPDRLTEAVLTYFRVTQGSQLTSFPVTPVAADGWHKSAKGRATYPQLAKADGCRRLPEWPSPSYS